MPYCLSRSPSSADTVSHTPALERARKKKGGNRGNALLKAAKLVIVERRPGEGADDVDAVLVDCFEHLGEKGLVVEGSLEVVALGVEGARVFHVRVCGA